MARVVSAVELYEQAIKDGLKEWTTTVEALSNTYAPKDTEELVDSSGTHVDDLTGQVFYTAEHARIVHEDLDAEHPHGGDAKFLERADDEVDGTAILAKHIGRING